MFSRNKIICGGIGTFSSSANSAPGEQTQRVRLNSIRLQFRIRLALKCHRQFLRPLAQRLRQRRQRRFNFRQRNRAQFFPIQIHAAILSREFHVANLNCNSFANIASARSKVFYFLALERRTLIVCLINKFMATKNKSPRFTFLALHFRRHARIFSAARRQ